MCWYVYICQLQFIFSQFCFSLHVFLQLLRTVRLRIFLTQNLKRLSKVDEQLARTAMWCFFVFFLFCFSRKCKSIGTVLLHRRLSLVWIDDRDFLWKVCPISHQWTNVVTDFDNDKQQTENIENQTNLLQVYEATSFDWTALFIEKHPQYLT